MRAIAGLQESQEEDWLNRGTDQTEEMEEQEEDNEEEGQEEDPELGNA